MDLSKSYEFFQPDKCDSRIHIIGCGSVGSTLAELLVRYGLTKITLYDFDSVEPHNLANQMFDSSDINEPKVNAVAKHLYDINPDIAEDLKLVATGWTGQKLNGYVFLCVDNIDLRREIVEQNMNNPFILAMFDFRTRLTDAQHYAADWSDPK
jgi:tRNA A37 threonylcarbamoyladenosine dehydratase